MNGETTMITTPARRLAPQPGRLRLTGARVLALLIGVPLVVDPLPATIGAVVDSGGGTSPGIVVGGT